jgi:hypothetical protein
MHKGLVIETFFNDPRHCYYYLVLPDVGEDGFYRDTMSFSAFFQSCRNPRANVTEVRQFTYMAAYEIQFAKKYRANVDWDNLKTFESIWEFYDFIGYDRHARKYKSGEAMKRWDGSRFVFTKRGKK